MIKAQDKRSLACTTCAKAKSRCIPGPEKGGKCERCHRLDKTCMLRTPAPPRAKSHTKRSRVAELEKRLSELEGNGVHVLAAAAEASSAPPQPASSFTTLPVHPKTSSSDGGSHHEQASSTSPPERKPSIKPSQMDMFCSPFFPSGSQSAPPPSSCSSSSQQKVKQEPPTTLARRPPQKQAWDSLWPLPGEAESLLVTYRYCIAPLYPFIPVPRIRASELKDTKPWLWKGIMMVACFLDGARHERLADELFADIGRATVLEGVCRLDLLQALHMLVSWYPYTKRKSSMQNLLFLARSICLGLGLGGNTFPSTYTTTSDLDPLRAYCGTYYLNTLVFTTNKRTEVLMNTTFLDKCCSLIEQANQLKGDVLLVKLVRIQELAQSISLTVALEPGQQAMALPMTMVVETYQDRLDAFRQSLPPELEDNEVLQSHMGVAGVLLTEWAISERYCSASNIALTDRLRLLWSCVQPLKTIFFCRLPEWNNLDSPKFLLLHGSDLTYALMTAIRLVTLRLPGWNLELIERELKFHEVMNHVVYHLADIMDKRRSGMFSSALRAECGDEATAANDPFQGLVDLVAGLRGHVIAAISRAQAASKAEDIAAAQMSASLGPNGVAPVNMEEARNEYWRDLMIESFWNGGGDFNYFEMLQ